MVRVLVLQLVEDDRAAAVAVEVPGDDAVDDGQPLVDVLQVGRVGGPCGALGGGQPAGETARVDLGVDVRTRAQDHVQAGLGGHAQKQVEVPDAGEVVLPGRGGVVVPGHVDADRVVAVGAQLLQDVPPQGRAREAEGVDLAGPEDDAPAVDQHRVLVEADGVPVAVGAGWSGCGSGGCGTGGVGAAAPTGAAQGEAECGGRGECAEGTSAQHHVVLRWTGTARVRPLSTAIRPTMVA